MAMSDTTSARPHTGEQAADMTASALTLVARGVALSWLNHARWAGPAFLLLVFASIAVFAMLRPVANWDMIPYLTIALENEGMAFDEVQRQAYAILRGALEPSAYAALTEGDAYRLRQYSDPVALQSMLGMYDVKWLYVHLLRALGPAVGWLDAFKAINLAALALFFVSLWAWMSRHKLHAFAPMIAATALLLHAADTFRIASPDFLAMALMTSGVLMLDRKRHVGAVVALGAAVLARPDSAIALCVIGGLLLALSHERQKLGLLLVATGFAAFAFTSAMGTSPGWWAHLWFSTYQIQDTMAGFAPEFSFNVYLTAFAFNAGRALTENVWLGAWLMAAFGFLWMLADSRGHERLREPRMIIIAGLLIAIAAKFIIFPLHDTRTYLPLLFPMMMLTGAQIIALMRQGATRLPG
jgi:hypothetical protein